MKNYFSKKFHNKKREFLEDLSSSELQLLFEHLRLGTDHLKQLLSPEQYKDLFKWYRLEEEQRDQIVSDKAEKTGQLALIINTILTSTFGAWMGLSGCLGKSLGSIIIFVIVVMVAFVTSSVIGYISLKYTKNQAKQAINTQKLANLQLRILQLLNQKLDKKIQEESTYLHTVIFLLEQDKEQATIPDNPSQAFDSTLEAFTWLEKLKTVLKNRLEHFSHETVYSLYWPELTKIINHIRKILAKNIHFVENLTGERFNTNQENMSSLPFLKILTDPAFAVPKFKPSSKSWIKDNLRGLILNLIPTIWGGFASMFVFVGGIPNILREFGFLSAAQLLTEPWARVIELALAVTMTVYFGFSSLYLTRKMSQRRSIWEKTQKEIAQEESNSLEKNQKLQLLFKVKTQLQKIVSIFNILKKLDFSLVKEENLTDDSLSGMEK